MNARYYGLILCGVSLINTQAQGDSWLNHLIAQSEQKNTKPVTTRKKTKGFFSEHGLVLFYSSSCPHCHRFAPVLQSWAERHQAEVLPLSLDNSALPQFPHFLPASTEWINAAFQNSTIQYPALFVVNPKNKTLYSVGFGFMNSDELNVRMEQLLPKISAYEHRRSQ
jgi:type-F conjugative transfer system pilin assembly thiol-disulfide isomerase TrbB